MSHETKSGFQSHSLLPHRPHIAGLTTHMLKSIPMDILPQLLINSLITGSIYALASSGLALSYGLLRVLNFAHGHFIMLGAYLFYLANVSWESGLTSSAVFCFICTIFIALLCFRVFIEPFIRYHTLLPFVTTIALSIMLESLVSIFFGVNVKSLSANYELQSYEWMGIFITPVQILIIISAVVLLSLLAALIHSTPLGRKVRALSSNSHAAESLGINSRLINYGAFILALLFAAYAGILIGYETNIQPTMGNSYTIKAFAAMVLGGLGNIWGTVLGAMLLGLIENLSIGLDFGSYSLPTGYKDAFAFVIILLTLLFKPDGLFEKKKRTV